MGVINHDDVCNDDASDDSDANNDDEHKWKWLMMRTTRTRLTIWCSNVFPISFHHISKEWDGKFQKFKIQCDSKFLLHQMIKVQYVSLHRCKSGSADLRLVSPVPLPGDDDYGDGGHKYADHGDSNDDEDDTDETNKRKCLISFFLSSKYYKPSKYNWFKSATLSFPGSCFEASTSLFLTRLLWLGEDGEWW